MRQLIFQNFVYKNREESLYQSVLVPVVSGVFLLFAFFFAVYLVTVKFLNSYQQEGMTLERANAAQRYYSKLVDSTSPRYAKFELRHVKRLFGIKSVRVFESNLNEIQRMPDDLEDVVINRSLVEKFTKDSNLTSSSLIYKESQLKFVFWISSNSGIRNVLYIQTLNPRTDLSFIPWVLLLLLLALLSTYFLAKGMFKKIEKKLKDFSYRVSSYDDSQLTSPYQELNVVATAIMKLTIQTRESERNRVLAETTQNLAHDLKGPLGVFETIAFGSLTDLGSNIPIMKSNILRLQSMIKAISNAELDSIIRPAQCSFDFDVIISTYVFQAKNAGVSLNNNTSEFSNLYLDKEKTYRAISNLIMNAIKSAQSNIEITANRVNHSLIVSVMDDGPGVPSEIQNKIFERGFSTKSSSGLGLDFVKHVASGHGGSIEYRREGSWSIFELTLNNVFRPEIDDQQVHRHNSSEDKRQEVIFISLLNQDLDLKISKHLEIPISKDEQSIESCLFCVTDDVDLFTNHLALKKVDVIFVSEFETLEMVSSKIKARWDYYAKK